MLERAEGLELDLVVVENGSPDETQDLVGREFPQARVLAVENRGFAAANNAGLATTDARWALFLNPDTEILDGSVADLVAGARRAAARSGSWACARSTRTGR